MNVNNALNKSFTHGLRVYISLLMIILISAVGIETLQAKVSLESLLDCTNQVRHSNEVNPLIHNQKLKRAAHQKIKDMKTYKYWAHQNPFTGDYAWEFIKDVGYDYLVAGENLAIGFTISDEICEAWANSPTHYDNLVNPAYKDIGFASQQVDLGSQTGVLVVQIFGTNKLAHNDKATEFISASLIESTDDKIGIFLLLILSLSVCRLGVGFLRGLKE